MTLWFGFAHHSAHSKMSREAPLGPGPYFILANRPALIYIPRGTSSQPREVCIPTSQESQEASLCGVRSIITVMAPADQVGAERNLGISCLGMGRFLISQKIP